MTLLKKVIQLAASLLIIVIFIINSDTAASGAIDGLIICANRIIPSLFPVTVFSVFLYQSRAAECILPESSNKDAIIIFTMSLIGGYPIGAKLISDAYNSGRLSIKKAQNMLFFCINAGPSFTVGVIGNCLFGSAKLGVILFASSVISAIIGLLIFNRNDDNSLQNNSEPPSISENFVQSVASASQTMITISSFVVLFATIIKVIKEQISNAFFKTLLIGFLEVTTAVGEFRNIYIIAFLVGFGGFSIFLQVLTLTRRFLPNIFKLFFSRILNGIIMTFITFFLLKIFPIDTQTISNGISPASPVMTAGSMTFTILFFISCFVLLYSLNSKKYCGKLSLDIF